MDGKQKKILTVVIVVANVVLWLFFVFPNLGMFSNLFTSLFNTSSSDSVDLTMPQSHVIKKLEKIDFNALRDPFVLPSMKIVLNNPNGKRPVPTHHPVVMPRPTPAPVNPDATNIIQRTYVSQFKLKSIVQLKNNYMAALEETTHYGNDNNNNQPYSYRFGAQQENNEAKSSLVIEGDVVLGERVVKIKENYVILEKNGLFYKLTFSGGMMVKDADQ